MPKLNARDNTAATITNNSSTTSAASNITVVPIEMPTTLFDSLFQPLRHLSHETQGLVMDDVIFRGDRQNLQKSSPLKKNEKKSGANLLRRWQELLGKERSNVMVLAGFLSIFTNPAFQALFAPSALELALLQKSCQFLQRYIRFQGKFNHHLSLKENQRATATSGTLDAIQKQYNPAFLKMQQEFVDFLPNFIALDAILRRKVNQDALRGYFNEIKMGLRQSQNESSSKRRKSTIAMVNDPSYEPPADVLQKADFSTRVMQIITRRELLMRDIYADIDEKSPHDAALSALCFTLAGMNQLVNSTMVSADKLSATVNSDPYCWRKIFSSVKWMESLKDLVDSQFKECKKSLNFLMELSVLLDESTFSSNKSADKLTIVGFALRYLPGVGVKAIEAQAVLSLLPDKMIASLKIVMPALQVWVMSEEFKQLSPILEQPREVGGAYEKRIKRQSRYGEAVAFYVHEKQRQEEQRQEEEMSYTAKPALLQLTQTPGIEIINEHTSERMPTIAGYNQKSSPTSANSLSKVSNKAITLQAVVMFCVIVVPALVVFSPLLWPAYAVLATGALMTLALSGHIALDLRDTYLEGRLKRNNESRVTAANEEAPLLKEKELKAKESPLKSTVAEVLNKQEERKTPSPKPLSSGATTRYSHNIYSFAASALMADRQKECEMAKENEKGKNQKGLGDYTLDNVASGMGLSAEDGDDVYSEINLGDFAEEKGGYESFPRPPSLGKI